MHPKLKNSCIFAARKQIKNMETITLQYDATNPALKGLIAALLKLDGISRAKTTKKKYSI